MNCECSKLEWLPEHYALPHHPDCKVKAMVVEGVQGFACESTPGTFPAPPKVYYFDPDSIIAVSATVYLNGKKHERCYAGYVTADSFLRPTHGKLIVGFLMDGKDVPAFCYTNEMAMKYSAFERGGMMVEYVEGNVFVDVQDKEALALYFKVNSD